MVVRAPGFGFWVKGSRGGRQKPGLLLTRGGFLSNGSTGHIKIQSRYMEHALIHAGYIKIHQDTYPIGNPPKKG